MQELANEFGIFEMDWTGLGVPRRGGIIVESFNTDEVGLANNLVKLIDMLILCYSRDQLWVVGLYLGIVTFKNSLKSSNLSSCILQYQSANIPYGLR